MNFPLKKIKPELLLLSFVILYFGFLLYELFYFSDSFSMSGLRQIDDATYHLDLQRIHHSLIKLDIKDLLKSNNNGYGWIFWTLNGIFSFPLYFLYKASIKVPLIVSGRFLCWLFSLASAGVLYKIAGEYTKSLTIKTLFLLTFLLFPHIPLWAMRFTPDTQAFFFLVLAFYLSIKYKDHNYQTLSLVALSYGASVGTKFTFIFILPFIAMNLLLSLWGKYPQKELLKRLAFFGISLFLSTMFFACPGSLIVFFTHEYLNHFKWMLRTYSALNVDVGESSGGLRQIFNSSIGQGYLGTYSAFALLLALGGGAIYQYLKDQKKKALISFLAFSTLVSTFLFLALTVKKGGAYINVYFHAVCFLFCFAYFIFEKKTKLNQLLAFALFGVVVFENGHEAFNGYTAFARMNQLPEIQMLRNAQQDLLPLINQDRDSLNRPIYALVDYRAIFPYTSLDDGFHNTVLIDDLSVRKNWAKSYDYVVLSRLSPLLQKDALITAFPKNAEERVKKVFLESLNETQTLFKTGLLGGKKYKNLYDKNGIVVFRKESEENGS